MSNAEIPHQTRLERMREAMHRDGIDIMFLNYGADFTYVTGLTAPLYYDILKSDGDWVTGLLFGVDHDPVLVMHEYFAIKVEDKTWVDDIRILRAGKDPNDFLSQVIQEFQPDGKTIAVDKMAWTQSLLGLQASAPTARFIVATDDYTDAIRVVKDPDEIALMQRAAEITDAAFDAVVKQMKPGMTEREIAIEVDYQIRRHGGDGYSFYPGIITVGNGSHPNRHIFERNTDLTADAGMTIAFDFGVLYHGYCSDFGRSVFIGEPNSEALSAYQSITGAMQRAMEEMGDGATTPARLCDFVNRLVSDDGFGEYYMYYGLGHSIGLDVHESPWLRPGYDEPVRAGMCFTLEPKIWKKSEFYVRCEDVVVVEPGHARSLTKYSYEPIVIG